MFKYYGSSDDLAKFATTEPELCSMVINVIKEWINPTLTSENVHAHEAHLVAQGIEDDAAHQMALSDLCEIGRSIAANVHAIINALIKGRTIPGKYYETVHGIVSAYLYFKMVEMRRQA